MIVIATGTLVLVAASRTTANVAGLSSCRLTSFSATTAPSVSEATGQNTLIFRLTNRSARCELDGYPTISFADRHGRIPFEIAERGDQMITGRSPRRVVAKRLGTVAVAINKYRCDGATLRVASAVRFRAAGTGLRLGLAHASRSIGWCGNGDPGSTVDVTPFEPSVAATRRR
jgi:hypothetical protein